MLIDYETVKIQLSKCDKLIKFNLSYLDNNFIVSSFYHTSFKSYGPDYNQITGTKDRFWTRGQFANQVTILGPSCDRVKKLHKYYKLVSVNMFIDDS